MDFARLADALVDLPPAHEGDPVLGADDVTEIVRGGFPGMRPLTGRALQLQLDGYIDRIVDRELPEAGFAVKSEGSLIYALSGA